MKGLVLAAGWPFAGLLALEAGRSGTSGTAPWPRLTDQETQL